MAVLALAMPVTITTRCRSRSVLPGRLALRLAVLGNMRRNQRPALRPAVSTATVARFASLGRTGIWSRRLGNLAIGLRSIAGRFCFWIGILSAAARTPAPFALALTGILAG